MFTGIIKEFGTIQNIAQEGSNYHFTIKSDISKEISIDQSVAHNGVCLTVVEIEDDQYKVTAVKETLDKTNLANWHKGDLINLELALKFGDRLDGHVVQGHVDTTGIVTDLQEVDGSHLFTFEFPTRFAALIIEKGSICINGTSLTAFNVGKNTFSVTIIPYTFKHTNFHNLKIGDSINLEFDILGKYLLRQSEIEK